MVKMEKLAADELSLEGVGPKLRRVREAQGLDLAQVAAATKIPVRHLEVIERGAFSELPARTYAIGFTRTYARMLGLDDNEVTKEVRAELDESGVMRPERIPGFDPGDPAKTPSSALAWSAAIAAIILLSGAVLFYNTYYGAGADPASLVVEEAPQVSSAEIVPSKAGPSASADLAGSAAPSAEGKVVFTALEDGIWVRIYDAAGVRLIDRKMMSGERFEIPANAQEPRINTGRPDAFAITIDGKPVPKLADKPLTVDDVQVSASALLARGQEPLPTALN